MYIYVVSQFFKILRQGVQLNGSKLSLGLFANFTVFLFGENLRVLE